MYNRTVELLYESELPARFTELGPYREADYETLPSEPRCELLYGRLIVSPSPSLTHQRVLRQLAYHFGAFAREQGGESFFAPLDVRLVDHSIVQPDLIYVSPQRSAILRERIFGAPDLVIEVLSPSTARRDLGAKLRLYADSGILEYWVVDPANRSFEFMVNEGGALRLRLPDQGIYRSERLAGLELGLDTFWSEIPG